jgi:hypothetical protein
MVRMTNKFGKKVTFGEAMKFCIGPFLVLEALGIGCVVYVALRIPSYVPSHFIPFLSAIYGMNSENFLTMASRKAHWRDW